MPSTSNTLWREVTIVNDLGLHARAAAKLAKAAQQATNNVWLECDSEKIDAKQVIDILTLAAAKGDRVTIRIEQAEDADALDQMAALVDQGFGE